MASESDSATSRRAGADVVGSAFLSVHPSVVFKLGADLITDDIQALVELVKNSYDAESPYCNVTIDTDAAVFLRGPGSEKDPARGVIRIEDAGIGMRRQDIIDGWLTVSASKKGALKRELKASKSLRRAPLGDKGLGRLGAQRLGRSLVLTTYPKLNPGETRDEVPAHRVTIVWSDFDNVNSLQAVPIRLEVIDAPEGRVGSTIEILGLSDRSTWAAQTAESSVDLEREFGTMLSPYDSQNGFVVNVRINGETIDLRERAREVLDRSTLSYNLDYDNQILRVGVAVAASYLRPATGAQDIADFDALVGEDNGFSFLNWLEENQSGAVRDLGIRGGDDQRFLVASTEIALDDVDPERDWGDEAGSPIDASTESDRREATRPIADPGPFNGRVDQVILRYDPTRGLFDSRAEYSDFVKTLSGVRIYRDGFGVRVNPDWINLASQWSSGRSWCYVSGHR